ncbi:MAG TPA: hypothetical protein VGP64_05200 [Polyangia bacterium]|jgi:hypothetical protein
MRRALLGLLVLTAGCGARSYIRADSARYPVSLSSGVRGADGKLVDPQALQKTGEFHSDYTACRMFWTLVPVKSAHRDISDEVNQQVAEAHGEAIVNLSVQSAATVWSFITFLGVFPDCGKVDITGDIVARQSLSASLAAPRP